jgi:hypothetical protein
MFAGTGKDGQAHQTGALADILGIRGEDNIIFYVTGCGFYGFFKPKNKDSMFFMKTTKDNI